MSSRSVGDSNLAKQWLRRTSSYQPILCSLLFAMSCASSGCQGSYAYHFWGVVKNSTDGNPINEVSVTLDVGAVDKDTPFTVSIGRDGSFGASFRVADGVFIGIDMPKWTLVLSKPGFQDEIIDVSPREQPESKKVTNAVVVVAYLRPK